MKNKNQFSIIVLVSFFCFFITGCKSDVKQDYKDAVEKYMNEAENAVDDFKKISNTAVDDVIQDAEELMNKAPQEIEKVMDEYNLTQ